MGPPAKWSPIWSATCSLAARGLEVGDEIGACLCVGNSGERHAVATEGRRLRILEEGVKLVRRPGHVRATHGRRIDEVVDACGLTPDDALEVRPSLVVAGLERMAGRALLEHGFAAPGILGADGLCE